MREAIWWWAAVAGFLLYAALFGSGLFLALGVLTAIVGARRWVARRRTARPARDAAR